MTLAAIRLKMADGTHFATGYNGFRWEAYNVFNHTQYSGINTAAKFDLTTGAQVNTLFGQVTSTRLPRVMQGSLRFTF